jgi:hypothetical protein
MQGSYHSDKPFLDAQKSFFVVTVFPAFSFEILRKYRKNWRVFECREALPLIGFGLISEIDHGPIPGRANQDRFL